jgi:hypothetical protein
LPTPLAGLLKNPTATFRRVGLLMLYDLMNWFQLTNSSDGDLVVVNDASELLVPFR